MFFKRGGLNNFAKNIAPCQLAMSVQADMGQSFRLTLNFMLIKALFYIMIQWVMGQNRFNSLPDDRILD